MQSGDVTWFNKAMVRVVNEEGFEEVSQLIDGNKNESKYFVDFLRYQSLAAK